MTTPKLLIVEDDFIIQMFLERVVSKMGLKVVGKASNSDDAIFLVNKTLPDIILMDIGLSGIRDGIETVRLIKEKHDIPTVFITGNSDTKTLERAEKVNPIHIIKKPIDEEMLKSEFDKICKKLSPKKETN